MAKSPTVSFAEMVRVLKASNNNLIDFSGGDTYAEYFSKCFEAGTSWWKTNGMRAPYPALRGSKKNRDGEADELVDRFIWFLRRQTQLEFSPDQVLVTPGAKQAYYLALQAIYELQGSGEIIIIAPAWPSLAERAMKVGFAPRFVSTLSDGSVCLDSLKQMISGNTRAIVINNPRNPDGHVFTRKELVSIVNIVESRCHKPIYLGDEVYQVNLFGKHEFISLLRVVPDRNRCITFMSASKGPRCAGFRIGLAAGPLPLITAMLDEQGASTHGVSPFFQSSLAPFFTEDGIANAQSFMTELERYLNIIEELAAETPFRLIRPGGTIYCCLDINAIINKHNRDRTQLTATEFAYAALNHGVAVMPCSDFLAPSLVRINLAQIPNQEYLEQGFQKLVATALTC